MLVLLLLLLTWCWWCWMGCGMFSIVRWEFTETDGWLDGMEVCQNGVDGVEVWLDSSFSGGKSAWRRETRVGIMILLVGN